MYPCELTQRATQPTLTIRFTAPMQELPRHFGRAYGEIAKYLAMIGEQPAGMPFALYHNMDMEHLDVEAGFPVGKPLPTKGEIAAGTIAGGTFAICHYTGPYDKCGPAYDALHHFIADKGYVTGDVAYEFYLNGPETPPEKLKTDLVFPVTRVTEPAAP